MALKTFIGGIHPTDYKRLSMKNKIRTIAPKNEEMFFPLIQHIGKPSIPVVGVGDYVLAGQLIARTDGDVSANLHASVSGTVTAIENRKNPSGSLVPGIVILNDGKLKEIPYPEDRMLEYLTRDTVLKAVKQAGIVGLGGSGMPAYVKIKDADPSQITAVIANCVESEPYLTGNYRRIIESPWKIIGGLMVLLTVYPNAIGYIAVSDNNEKGYALLKELLRDSDRMYVVKLENKYPQGSERQLIFAVTGRTMNAAMLPHDIGCLVQNADTLVAINQAVIMHEPLITRIITVTGDAVVRPGNYRVRIGMSYRDLIEAAGGLKNDLTPDDVVYIDGGTMTGEAIRELDVPIIKTSKGIVVLKREGIARQKETACTRCGRCVEACPSKLVPIRLYKYVQKNKNDDFVRLGGAECCACGSCSYICPAKIDLASAITSKRKEVLADKKQSWHYQRRQARR